MLVNQIPKQQREMNILSFVALHRTITICTILFLLGSELFAQVDNREKNMYPRLREILDDPLSEKGCDIFLEAHKLLKEKMLIDAKKRFKEIRRSKEKQRLEAEKWDITIKEADLDCRNLIETKRPIKDFCVRVRSKHYYSPC